MIIRKFLVTIHEDGHLTAIEYDEPQGFVYRAREAVVRDAYNRALSDVKTILEAEKARCDIKCRLDTKVSAWATSWKACSIECELLENLIEKLFRRS